MSDDPDPHCLIQSHCDHLTPPQWVSDAYDFTKDKTTHCHHCHEKFIPFLQIGRISKHHCRLCGEMCCRSCTSKLKVPHRFEKKGKDLSRVCHACLLGVLAKRVIEGETQPVVKTRVVKYVWGGREPATIAEKQKLLPRVFFPAHWENVYDTATCFICAVRTDRRHHCRLCGLLFCGDCSQKMADVPQEYDQKNKPGAKRVCDYCRFCWARGWRFAKPGEKPTDTKANEYKIQPDSGGAPLGYTHDPSKGVMKAVGRATATPPPPPPPAAAPPTRPPAISTQRPPPIHAPVPPHAAAGAARIRPLSQCSMSLCSSAATVGGFCSVHDVANSSLPKNSPATFNVVVRFRFEDDADLFTSIECIGHADLHAMHNMVTQAHPLLDPTKVSYVVRGRQAQKMHWRMFEARFAVPEIIIKKLQPFDHRAINAPHTSTPYTPFASSSPLSPFSPQSLPPRLPSRMSSPVTLPVSPRPPSPVRSSMIVTVGPQTLTREQMLAQSKPSRAHRISPAASRIGSPATSPTPSRQQSPSRHTISVTAGHQTREQMMAQSKPSRAGQRPSPATSGVTSPVTSPLSSPSYSFASPVASPSAPSSPPPLRLNGPPPPPIPLTQRPPVPVLSKPPIRSSGPPPIPTQPPAAGQAKRWPTVHA